MRWSSWKHPKKAITKLKQKRSSEIIFIPSFQISNEYQVDFPIKDLRNSQENSDLDVFMKKLTCFSNTKSIIEVN